MLCGNTCRMLTVNIDIIHDVVTKKSIFCGKISTGQLIRSTPFPSLLAGHVVCSSGQRGSGFLIQFVAYYNCCRIFIPVYLTQPYHYIYDILFKFYMQTTPGDNLNFRSETTVWAPPSKSMLRSDKTGQMQVVRVTSPPTGADGW